jgi:hypothetical protein
MSCNPSVTHAIHTIHPSIQPASHTIHPTRPPLVTHRTVPSSDAVMAVNRSVGCHTPPVSPDTWPFVFRMSLMYMSPRMNSPFSRPSRSKI